MTKIMKYLTKRQWVWIGICVLFIVGQVWLDLKCQILLQVCGR